MKRAVLAVLTAAMLAGCSTPEPPATYRPTPDELAAWQAAGESYRAECAPLTPVLTEAGLECRP